MRSMKIMAAGALMLAVAAACALTARAQGKQPLSEENLAKMVGLQLDDEAVINRIKAGGLEFAVNEASIDRLSKAGASSAVIAAVRAAAVVPAAHAAKAVTYAQVLELLKLGLTEKDIVRRLEVSPTVFTLDATQVDDLKRAGASDALLATMQKLKTPAAAAAHGPKITDLAIVLDCSGSMGEPTRDGHIKMDVAKAVTSELIAQMPEKLRVTLVVYGFDRNLACEAVQVARPLGELGSAGKSELAGIIAGLQPVANTPIARALEVAGAELSKNDAPCGLILITDGKETCGGNPAEVAGGLAAKMHLTYGINVIGFDVKDDERASLTDVASAGKGRYYNAGSAAELIEIVRGMQKELQVVARPAPTKTRVKVGAARFVEIMTPTVELPPMDRVILTPSGVDAMAIGVDNVARTDKYGDTLRIAPTVKAAKFDIWWRPAQGRAVRIVTGLSINEGTVQVKPEQYLGMVRVTGAGLPAADGVYLAPIGTEAFALRATAIQAAPGYGKNMGAPPGQYDVWIEPAGNGKAERIAEKLEVSAGQVTVVE